MLEVKTNVFLSSGYYYEIPSIGAIRINTQVKQIDFSNEPWAAAAAAAAALSFQNLILAHWSTCVLCPLVVEWLSCR